MIPNWAATVCESMSDHDSSNLQNQFLVAMPGLADPYFASTVTYLWRHSDDGALGIVINKPMQASLTHIFDELEIEYAKAATFQQQKILAGGPVEREKGFIIHDHSRDTDESSFPVTNEISINTSKDMLQRIARGEGPENYIIALGCAGWDKGQLEQEIIDNSWLTVPANSELIFSHDYANKAAAVAGLLGIDLNQLSSLAGHS